MSSLRVLVLIGACATASLAGCARSTVTIDVGADGRWKRTVELRGQGSDPAGGMTMGPTLDQTFVLPQGAGVATSRTKEKNEDVYTASRTMAAGQTVSGDLTIKAGPKAPKQGTLLSTSATIVELAPGRWEYRETLKWSGDRPKQLDEFATANSDAAAEFKKALPPEMASDVALAKFGGGMSRELWRMLFGPPKPLLMDFLTNPALAESQIRREVGRATIKVLADQFGSKLTPAQRLAVARRLASLAALKANESRGKEDPGSGQASEDNFVAMTFRLNTPGTVVEANGEIDEVAGAVYWGMYHLAAAPQDLVLRAVWETPRK